MEHLRTRLALAAALLAVATGAACGGDDSRGGAAREGPPETGLQQARPRGRSEAPAVVPGSLASEPGPVASRGFYVAADCHGAETTPNTITVFQFASNAAADDFEPKIHSSYPKGQVASGGPLIIVATGPQAKENLDAV